MKPLWTGMTLLLLFFAQLSWAATWQVNYDNSRLGFIATQTGSEFEGQFHNFEARIVFDPADPANSRFDVVVDITSIDTQSPDRDSALPNPEWFDAAKFPSAHFEAISFKQVGNASDEAKARLTLAAPCI